MKPSALAAAITFIVCCAAAQAQLIVNGSFEQPAVAQNLNFVGSFSFPGWSAFSTSPDMSIGNSGISVGVDFGLSPYEGNQAFGFNGNNPPAGSYVEQTFTTSPGLYYFVTFAVGRNNGFPSQVLQMRCEAFDSSLNVLSQVIATAPATVGYSVSSFTFRANTPTSTIRFTDSSSDNPNTDLFLDGVAVQAIPEPATSELIFFCFLAAGCFWMFCRHVV